VMAMGETWVTMVGNLTSEPVHHSERVHGHDVVSFGLRSVERRFDKERGEWGDGRQLAVKVTCWRRLAMSAFSCLSKGDPVIVAGRLRGAETAEEIPAPLGIPELEAFSIGPNLARWRFGGPVATRRGGHPCRPEGIPWSPHWKTCLPPEASDALSVISG
jgi:single-strand DNA-binding protein